MSTVIVLAQSIYVMFDCPSNIIIVKVFFGGPFFHIVIDRCDFLHRYIVGRLGSSFYPEMQT